MDQPPRYVTDITHFLTEKGDFPDDIPVEARSLANFLGKIIAFASKSKSNEMLETDVLCQIPGGDNCAEPLLACIERGSNQVLWLCLKCGAEGSISNWKNTLWDCTEGDVVAN